MRHLKEGKHSMHRSSFAAAVMISALMFVPAMAQSLTVTGSAPAEAGGMDQVWAKKISYADLDLGTAQGATTLFNRIDAAARSVCGERDGLTMNAARAKAFAKCYARTVHYAVKEVDAPQLTQIAAAH
jgi:UrcA family protein